MTQMMDMLRDFTFAGNSTYYSTACRWLRGHTSVWEAWLLSAEATRLQ